MKELILSHESALGYWSRPVAQMPMTKMNAELSNQILADTPDSLSRADCKALIQQFGLNELPGTMHLLVSCPSKRRVLKGVSFHSNTTPLPSDSLVRACSHQVLCNRALFGLSCVSPELCFVQMAKRMSFLELLELGYELCGSYCLPAGENGNRRNGTPVTSPALIRSFVNEASRIHGVKRSRATIPYIHANSRSPKESQIAMMLVLPRSLGGFGLPAPILNREIPVSNEIARVLKAGKLIPDMYWPKIGTVLEYDSDECHDTEQDAEHDARKRSAYRLLGLDVITLNYDQLRDFTTFAAVSEDLARRLHPNRRATSFAQRQEQSRVHARLMYGKRCRWK